LRFRKIFSLTFFAPHHAADHAEVSGAEGGMWTALGTIFMQFVKSAGFFKCTAPLGGGLEPPTTAEGIDGKRFPARNA
jgi:hypothetical protein